MIDWKTKKSVKAWATLSLPKLKKLTGQREMVDRIEQWNWPAFCPTYWPAFLEEWSENLHLHVENVLRKWKIPLAKNWVAYSQYCYINCFDLALYSRLDKSVQNRGRNFIRFCQNAMMLQFFRKLCKTYLNPFYFQQIKNWQQQLVARQ